MLIDCMARQSVYKYFTQFSSFIIAVVNRLHSLAEKCNICDSYHKIKWKLSWSWYRCGKTKWIYKSKQLSNTCEMFEAGLGISSLPIESSQTFSQKSSEFKGHHKSTKVPSANSWCWQSGPPSQNDFWLYVHELTDFYKRKQLSSTCQTFVAKDRWKVPWLRQNAASH